jgi:hypothetical protein
MAQDVNYTVVNNTRTNLQNVYEVTFIWGLRYELRLAYMHLAYMLKISYRWTIKNTACASMVQITLFSLICWRHWLVVL